MTFQLPKLPYETTALQPVISKETFEFHYGKHHKAYVDKLNELLGDSPLKGASLEEIVKKSSGGMFNNAAQAWNHTFYWYNFTANAGENKAGSALEKAVNEAFGSKEKALEQMVAQGVANFGSGWTWLVRDKAGKVSIVNTSNAETPITKDLVPLLTLDVWEHAYYIDYRNARKGHLDAAQKILNWKFASERYDSNEIFDATKLMKV
jgi:Fe-Mn family superoxide dismutase